LVTFTLCYVHRFTHTFYGYVCYTRWRLPLRGSHVYIAIYTRPYGWISVWVTDAVYTRCCSVDYVYVVGYDSLVWVVTPHVHAVWIRYVTRSFTFCVYTHIYRLVYVHVYVHVHTRLHTVYTRWLLPFPLPHRTPRLVYTLHTTTHYVGGLRHCGLHHTGWVTAVTFGSLHCTHTCTHRLRLPLHGWLDCCTLWLRAFTFGCLYVTTCCVYRCTRSRLHRLHTGLFCYAVGWFGCLLPARCIYARFGWLPRLRLPLPDFTHGLVPRSPFGLRLCGLRLRGYHTHRFYVYMHFTTHVHVLVALRFTVGFAVYGLRLRYVYGSVPRLHLRLPVVYVTFTFPGSRTISILRLRWVTFTFGYILHTAHGYGYVGSRTRYYGYGYGLFVHTVTFGCYTVGRCGYVTFGWFTDLRLVHVVVTHLLRLVTLLVTHYVYHRWVYTQFRLVGLRYRLVGFIHGYVVTFTFTTHTSPHTHLRTVATHGLRLGWLVHVHHRYTRFCTPTFFGCQLCTLRSRLRTRLLRFAHVYRYGSHWLRITVTLHTPVYALRLPVGYGYTHWLPLVHGLHTVTRFTHRLFTTRYYTVTLRVHVYYTVYIGPTFTQLGSRYWFTLQVYGWVTRFTHTHTYLHTVHIYHRFTARFYAFTTPVTLLGLRYVWLRLLRLVGYVYGWIHGLHTATVHTFHRFWFTHAHHTVLHTFYTVYTHGCYARFGLHYVHVTVHGWFTTLRSLLHLYTRLRSHRFTFTLVTHHTFGYVTCRFVHTRSHTTPHTTTLVTHCGLVLPHLPVTLPHLVHYRLHVGWLDFTTTTHCYVFTHLHSTPHTTHSSVTFHVGSFGFPRWFYVYTFTFGHTFAIPTRCYVPAGSRWFGYTALGYISRTHHGYTRYYVWFTFPVSRLRFTLRCYVHVPVTLRFTTLVYVGSLVLRWAHHTVGSLHHTHGLHTYHHGLVCCVWFPPHVFYGSHLRFWIHTVTYTRFAVHTVYLLHTLHTTAFYTRTPAAPLHHWVTHTGCCLDPHAWVHVTRFWVRTHYTHVLVRFTFAVGSAHYVVLILPLHGWFVVTFTVRTHTPHAVYTPPHVRSHIRFTVRLVPFGFTRLHCRVTPRYGLDLHHVLRLRTAVHTLILFPTRCVYGYRFAVYVYAPPCLHHALHTGLRYTYTHTAHVYLLFTHVLPGLHGLVYVTTLVTVTPFTPRIRLRYGLRSTFTHTFQVTVWLPTVTVTFTTTPPGWFTVTLPTVRYHGSHLGYTHHHAVRTHTVHRGVTLPRFTFTGSTFTRSWITTFTRLPLHGSLHVSVRCCTHAHTVPALPLRLHGYAFSPHTHARFTHHTTRTHSSTHLRSPHCTLPFTLRFWFWVRLRLRSRFGSFTQVATVRFTAHWLRLRRFVYTCARFHARTAFLRFCGSAASVPRFTRTYAHAPLRLGYRFCAPAPHRTHGLPAVARHRTTRWRFTYLPRSAGLLHCTARHTLWIGSRTPHAPGYHGSFTVCLLLRSAWFRFTHAPLPATLPTFWLRLPHCRRSRRYLDGSIHTTTLRFVTHTTHYGFWMIYRLHAHLDYVATHHTHLPAYGLHTRCTLRVHTFTHWLRFTHLVHTTLVHTVWFTRSTLVHPPHGYHTYVVHTPHHTVVPGSTHLHTTRLRCSIYRFPARLHTFPVTFTGYLRLPCTQFTGLRAHTLRLLHTGYDFVLHTLRWVSGRVVGFTTFTRSFTVGFSFTRITHHTVTGYTTPHLPAHTAPWDYTHLPRVTRFVGFILHTHRIHGYGYVYGSFTRSHTLRLPFGCTHAFYTHGYTFYHVVLGCTHCTRFTHFLHVYARTTARTPRCHHGCTHGSAPHACTHAPPLRLPFRFPRLHVTFTVYTHTVTRTTARARLPARLPHTFWFTVTPHGLPLHLPAVHRTHYARFGSGLVHTTTLQFCVYARTPPPGSGLPLLRFCGSGSGSPRFAWLLPGWFAVLHRTAHCRGYCRALRFTPDYCGCTMRSPLPHPLPRTPPTRLHCCHRGSCAAACRTYLRAVALLLRRTACTGCLHTVTERTRICRTTLLHYRGSRIPRLLLPARLPLHTHRLSVLHWFCTHTGFALRTAPPLHCAVTHTAHTPARCLVCRRTHYRAHRTCTTTLPHAVHTCRLHGSPHHAHTGCTVTTVLPAYAVTTPPRFTTPPHCTRTPRSHTTHTTAHTTRAVHGSAIWILPALGYRFTTALFPHFATATLTLRGSRFAVTCHGSAHYVTTGCYLVTGVGYTAVHTHGYHTFYVLRFTRCYTHGYTLPLDYAFCTTHHLPHTTGYTPLPVYRIPLRLVTTVTFGYRCSLRIRWLVAHIHTDYTTRFTAHARLPHARHYPLPACVTVLHQVPTGSTTRFTFTTPHAPPLPLRTRGSLRGYTPPRLGWFCGYRTVLVPVARFTPRTAGSVPGYAFCPTHCTHAPHTLPGSPATPHHLHYAAFGFYTFSSPRFTRFTCTFVYGYYGYVATTGWTTVYAHLHTWITRFTWRFRTAHTRFYALHRTTPHRTRTRTRSHTHCHAHTCTARVGLHTGSARFGCRLVHVYCTLPAVTAHTDLGSTHTVNPALHWVTATTHVLHSSHTVLHTLQLPHRFGSG